MAALATATLTRRGATDVVVVNRTPQRASRLAAEHGVRAASLDALAAEVARADVVVACTGSTGVLVTADMVAAGQRELAIVDLALPHDVDPGVRERAGVTLVTLADLADDLRDSAAGAEVDAVREIVTEEVAAFLTARRQASVTPTVVALRSMATEVVDAELARLLVRLPDLDDTSRDEVLQSLRRVADKLLHQPTIRVKELANETGAVSYAAALAELFALDPDAVEAVTRPEGLAP
jgi:glutamyl-tRNA reductase